MIWNLGSVTCCDPIAPFDYTTTVVVCFKIPLFFGSRYDLVWLVLVVLFLNLYVAFHFRTSNYFAMIPFPLSHSLWPCNLYEVSLGWMRSDKHYRVGGLNVCCRFVCDLYSTAWSREDVVGDKTRFNAHAAHPTHCCCCCTTGTLVFHPVGINIRGKLFVHKLGKRGPHLDPGTALIYFSLHAEGVAAACV